MMRIIRIYTLLIVVLVIGSCTSESTHNETAHSDSSEVAEDPLSLWSTSPRKAAIIDFVKAVSDDGGPDFVPEPDRIAVFDNDGTLWVEQPMYIQLAFALDKAKVMAQSDAQLAEKEPFKSLLAGDMGAVMKGGESALIEILTVSHSEMSSEEFEREASQWLSEARHPKYDRLYRDLTFDPMVQLLEYLRDNGFTTYIVSGGGIDFIRYISDDLYGIPPSQVVGSSLMYEYEIVDGKPVIMRKPEIFFVDDKAGKPVGILHHIGQKPIAAFGNSDGDFQMLEWTSSHDGRTLCMMVHHTDAEREYAYDREGHIGVLNRGLDEAESRGWYIIDMAEDWEVVFD